MTESNHLNVLENEAIYILYEVAGQFENPCLLFSGGKDSTTLVHLVAKAFPACKFPFQLVHIDTGQNFPETIAFRDKLVQQLGIELTVRYVDETIKTHCIHERRGDFTGRNPLQTITLLDTIKEFGFDACIGGGRRDEEKARAKERIFSFRDKEGRWNPNEQRIECWDLLNGKVNEGEHIRVFPLSNWTELDVWEYIKKENINMPSLYFSHLRSCVEKKEGLYAYSDFVEVTESDLLREKYIRFRTVGDMSCTSAIESKASSVEEVLLELKVSKLTERGSRMDDKVSDNAMEQRKRGGYF